uniref:Cytosine-specific methyltransferase n=1 Tax=Bacteroides coprosuis TaxID=151276 RepID=Q8VR10_9BACE|nr:putative C-5 cytosine-specific DNA methylase [Bacteroides coprosuis DSM 18011]
MKDDDIYEYVRSKRKKLGVTQKQLSLLLGMKEVGERTVRSWEIGEHKPSKARIKRLQELNINHPFKTDKKEITFKFIDLFAGIGGIRLPFQLNGGECVFSSEIDYHAQKTYYSNYGDYPSGDITKIKAEDIPDHDILLAGFPCQAFSQAGLGKGFNDTRGTMFFEIQRILAEKQPKMFLLENVKRLISHDGKKTFKTMIDILSGSHNEEIPKDFPISDEARKALSKKLNYWIDFKVLNAKDFGSPQNRERIYIVGFNKNHFTKIDDFNEIFQFPEPSKEKVSVKDVLEKIPANDTIYTISERIWQGHQKRKLKHQNKGNGFGFSLFNENSEYTNTISARYYKDGSEALMRKSKEKFTFCNRITRAKRYSRFNRLRLHVLKSPAKMTGPSCSVRWSPIASSC